MTSKLFVSLRYDLDKIEHADLKRDYYNSTYFISAGYKYSINKINEVSQESDSQLLIGLIMAHLLRRSKVNLKPVILDIIITEKNLSETGL